MFDFREFYKEKNQSILGEYQNTLKEIKEILDFTETNKIEEKNKYFDFFHTTAQWILELANYEEKLNEAYFTSKTFEELLEENNRMYEELQEENYETSYANPSYAVKLFGEKEGQIFTYCYAKFRAYIQYAFHHKLFKMNDYNKIFIKMYQYIMENEVEYETLKAMICDQERAALVEDTDLLIKEVFTPSVRYYKEMIENADLTDLRYLMKYGQFITENEIKTANFLLNYPEDKVKQITKTVVTAYINGFKRDNKDLSKKGTVKVICNVGQEIIIKELIKEFKDNNLDVIITSVTSTEANKQYTYDHRFDNAMYIEEAYIEQRERAFEQGLQNNKELLSKYSGPAVFEKFGEIPFAPQSKKEALKLSEAQSKLFQGHQGRIRALQNQYMPADETSFTIIAFPTPEIGTNFEEIFQDTLEINMLDSDKYEKIHQSIIDALDQGIYVHVKGKGTNETDIKVKMQPLQNPEKETNFVNCVADVNIPVGEVFTSPQLKDTNGVLHVEEVYLQDLKFENLKLLFKDGYIEEYSCTNFQDEEENKKYIEENLLFPNKTLPLGEFAIGTNTLAYVIAQKHNIVNLLPILIVEKMGPHFAIGDTCFAWSEDTPVYNPLDKKEITARDNEKSILRKSNVNEAYTQRHTDITLPYDGLEFISVITETGATIEIIREGRFVLEGTEELNKPFN